MSNLLSTPLNLRHTLRWIWTRARGQGRGVAAVTAAGIGAVGASLAFVWATKHIVDLATGRADGTWAAAIALLVGCLAARLGFSALQKRLGVGCSTRYANRLRARLFATLMGARWDGRDRFHSSDAINRLAADVDTTASMLATTLPGVAVTAIELLAAFAFMLALDVRMACVLVAIMPVAMAASKLYTARSHRLTARIRERQSDLQRVMQENLQHRVLINSLGRTDAAVDEFAGQQNSFYSLVMKRNDISLYASTAVGAGFMAGYTVAFLWCAFGLADGTVTFGAMTAFLQLVARVQRPVVDLAGRVPAFVNASVAVDRLGEIESLPQAPRESEQWLEAPASLRFRSATYTYPDGDRPVIDGFSHEFAPGEITVVAGETGVGKTTLIMLMLGMLTPAGGRVEVFDRTGRAETASAGTRCNMVYVPQGNSLLSGTIRSNLLLGCPDATEAQMREALRRAAADFVFGLPRGLDTPCGERGAGLSEGQAQRVAIARGLLGRGSILILDEPTAALDAATEAALMASLERESGRRTIIIISHSHHILAASTRIVRL